MDTKNKLIIDYSSNPELSAVLSAKKPGEKVSLEIEVTVDRNDANELVASLDSVTAEVEGEDEETLEVAPEISADSPVMVVIKGRPDATPKKPKADQY